MCKYMFYKEVGSRQPIFCNQTNEMCTYQRFCSVQNRIILSEGWKQCRMMNKKIIPNGTKEVLFEKNGFLYIKLDDKTIKVKNRFDKVPEYVYIKEGIEANDYDLSLIPFKEEKVYIKRKTSIENE